MSQWQDYAQEGKALEWPYPVRYGEERKVHTDVLVLGAVSPGVGQPFRLPGKEQRWPLLKRAPPYEAAVEDQAATTG